MNSWVNLGAQLVEDDGFRSPTSVTADVAGRLKALADPARLRMLAFVVAAGDDGTSILDLVPRVGLSQPTVSHHVGVLEAAGLVRRVKSGVWRYVIAESDVIKDIGDGLASLSKPSRRARR